jgi:hypothetical protein
MSVHSINERSRRELAHRSGDGLEVQLLWNAEDDSVWVIIYDHRYSAVFDIPVPRHRAMHAFHHPYSYASAGALAA